MGAHPSSSAMGNRAMNATAHDFGEPPWEVLRTLAERIRGRAAQTLAPDARNRFAELLSICAEAARVIENVDAGVSPEGAEEAPIQDALGFHAPPASLESEAVNAGTMTDQIYNLARRLYAGYLRAAAPKVLERFPWEVIAPETRAAWIEAARIGWDFVVTEGNERPEAELIVLREVEI